MIPSAFLERMKTFPGLDFDAFSAALEQPAVRAMRTNLIKTSPERLLPLLPFAVEPIPFLPDSFYTEAEKVGGLPAHHAGMFYMQDPSAICAAASVSVPEGAVVLDLCAAPGGKSTQLAAAIGKSGILVSNEYVTSRCRILQSNLERIGATNTVVTNLDSKAIADFYGAIFDLVVVDAPCSGEGMFRKYEIANTEWGLQNVILCAERQKEILKQAVRCVRPGGQLLYSTCTFSLEENEQNIDWLLRAYPEFKLIPVRPEIAAVTADGICFPGCRQDLQSARRFYPHLSPGEGQFVALLERSEEGPDGRMPATDGLQPLNRKETETVDTFFHETLNTSMEMRIGKLRDEIWLAPEIPVPQKGVFAAGVCLGTLQKERIIPHHQFFSAMGTAFCRQLSLREGDPRIPAYLRGEEIPCPELADVPNGYAAVLYEGVVLGGGKAVSGVLKNHYPKGLRSLS